MAEKVVLGLICFGAGFTVTGITVDTFYQGFSASQEVTLALGGGIAGLFVFPLA
jgi:hypothetical protein